MLQFLVGLFDRGALPGHNAEAPPHLPQLVQVAVLGLALQRQLVLLQEGAQTNDRRRLLGEKEATKERMSVVFLQQLKCSVSGVERPLFEGLVLD